MKFQEIQFNYLKAIHLIQTIFSVQSVEKQKFHQTRFLLLTCVRDKPPYNKKILYQYENISNITYVRYAVSNMAENVLFSHLDVNVQCHFRYLKVCKTFTYDWLMTGSYRRLWSSSGSWKSSKISYSILNGSACVQLSDLNQTYNKINKRIARKVDIKN